MFAKKLASHKKIIEKCLVECGWKVVGQYITSDWWGKELLVIESKASSGQKFLWFGIDPASGYLGKPSEGKITDLRVYDKDPQDSLSDSVFESSLKLKDLHQNLPVLKVILTEEPT